MTSNFKGQSCGECKSGVVKPRKGLTFDQNTRLYVKQYISLYFREIHGVL